MDPSGVNAGAAVVIAFVWLAGIGFVNLPTYCLRASARIGVLALLVLAVAVTMTVSTELLTQAGPFQIWQIGIDTL